MITHFESSTDGYYICYVMCKGKCVLEINGKTVNAALLCGVRNKLKTFSCILYIFIENVTLKTYQIQTGMMRSKKLFLQWTWKLKDAILF